MHEPSPGPARLADMGPGVSSLVPQVPSVPSGLRSSPVPSTDILRENSRSRATNTPDTYLTSHPASPQSFQRKDPLVNKTLPIPQSPPPMAADSDSSAAPAALPTFHSRRVLKYGEYGVQIRRPSCDLGGFDNAPWLLPRFLLSTSMDSRRLRVLVHSLTSQNCEANLISRRIPTYPGTHKVQQLGRHS